MKELKQGQGELEDYIAQFHMLKARSRITEDVALIELFMDGLHPKILEKVFTKDVLPITLEGRMDAASKFDGQWKRAKVIAGKACDKLEKKATPPKKETNTLDINRLTSQERADHMKKGLCFVCHQPGHRSSDHKDGNPSYPANTNGNRYHFPQKKTGADTYGKIHALMAELDDEEKGKALNMMEESGF